MASNSRKGLAWTGLGLVVASTVLGVAVLMIVEGDVVTDSSVVIPIEPSNQFQASQSSDSQEFIVDTDSRTELNERLVSNLQRLNLACPDVQAELTSECIDVLDEFFIDSVLPHWQSWKDSLVHLGEPPTFERVFGDPSANRSLAMEALGREDCRLEHGAIHLNLKASCNAEAIASHALFTKYCMPSTSNYRDDWFGLGVGGSELPELGEHTTSYYKSQQLQIESSRDLDLDQYEQQKQRLKNMVLRSAWIESQCSKVDSRLSQPLNIWPSIQQSVMAEYAEQFSDNLLQWEPGVKIRFHREILIDEYSRLLSIAARLGDDWAVTEYYRQRKRDEEFLTSIEETRPWLPCLHRATLPGTPKAKVLEDAIRAVTLADRDGLEIDRKLLVHAVCREIPFSNENCATAFRQIESLELSPREFKVASELRVIAYTLYPESF